MLAVRKAKFNLDIVSILFLEVWIRLASPNIFDQHERQVYI